MITNADITLFNHKLNKNTRLDDWQRTVIKGVSFYVDHKVAVGDKGLSSSDVYKIRIPEDAVCEKSYISSIGYLVEEDVSNYWTLQHGDIIVEGICEVDIKKPADLTEKGIKYCKITSYADRRFGGLPHWRIAGE